MIFSGGKPSFFLASPLDIGISNSDRFTPSWNILKLVGETGLSPIW